MVSGEWLAKRKSRVGSRDSKATTTEFLATLLLLHRRFSTGESQFSRSARRKAILLLSVVLLTLFGNPLCIGQITRKYIYLFQELKSTQTTDRAAEQLLRLGKTSAATREYLTAHLPPVIQSGPQVSFSVWYNCVKLAGELKIVEAAPSLTKWIWVRAGNPATTFTEEVELRKSPAGKALVHIGDPAIPALEASLEHGKRNERWDAVLVLNLIGSAKAKTALREDLAHEPDDTLRDFIKKTLTR